TTAELAKRCGVRENILYRLWPDKKAMFIASIDYVYALSFGTWSRLRAEALPDSAAAHLFSYESEHHGACGLYRIGFAGLSETDDPEIGAALRRMYGRFQRFIREWIERDRRNRKDKGSPDPELAAWAIVGLGTVANIGREMGLLDAATRKRLMNDVGTS